MCFRPSTTSELPTKCPECGFMNKPGLTKCLKCGVAFAAKTLPDPQAPVTQTNTVSEPGVPGIPHVPKAPGAPASPKPVAAPSPAVPIEDNK